MKIIHTSDWHLGHSLYGFETIEDQRLVLNRITEICQDEKPDLFLLAGDIFDVARPAMAVQKMFVETVCNLRRLLPDMAIVIIAGNHDSASLHEVFSRPWQELGVTVIGEASTDIEKMAQRRLVIDNQCVVVAIPYFPERFIHKDYIKEVIARATEDCDDSLPRILMLHTTLSGCDYSGHNQEDKYVGGIAGVALESIGDNFDYLAVGHIHRSQTIRERIRYCGSPKMISFDENYPHGVTIVEICSRGERPKIKEIVIDAGRKLITLPENGFASRAELFGLVENMGQTSDFFRLNLSHGEILTPLEIAELRSKIASLGGTLCCINREGALAEMKGEEESIDIDTFKELSPLEVADRYFRSIGAPLTDEQTDMLRDIILSITDEERK